jgi:hypothetical protein
MYRTGLGYALRGRRASRPSRTLPLPRLVPASQRPDQPVMPCQHLPHNYPSGPDRSPRAACSTCTSAASAWMSVRRRMARSAATSGNGSRGQVGPGAGEGADLRGSRVQVEDARLAVGGWKGWVTMQGTPSSQASGVVVRAPNRQTEGQINRLKLLKRQMYGRVGFTLLRQRVLHRG